jgi:hypothetical protein
MTTDLKARLDAMVRKRIENSRLSSEGQVFYLSAVEHVATDLISLLDACEAEVKALTAERDGLIMDACIGAAIIAAFRGEPVSDFEESFPDVMDAKMARAALKLGGETPAKPKPMRPDWIIEIESVNGPCYVNEGLEGDPGRTCNLADAERYATENEARENMSAIRRKYPHRKYSTRALKEDRDAE